MSGTRSSWTVRDLVIVALISAVFGVAMVPTGYLWNVVNAAGGPIAGACVSLFQWGWLLAVYIVRKPMVATATSVLSTVVEALAGHPAGMIVLGWGVVHGLTGEAFFAATGYRKHTPLLYFLAAGVAAQMGAFWTFYLYGWSAAMELFYISIPILIVMSGIQSGLLAYWLGKQLARTGFVKISE